jgi:hypothetical protein
MNTVDPRLLAERPATSVLAEAETHSDRIRGR